jgi:hypothetical protein
MTRSEVPRIPKWPFLAGDALLLGVAAWIVAQQPSPLPMGPMVCMAGSVALGAWLAVIPFLKQYQAAVTVAEADALTTVVEQVNQVQTLASQISFATAQWQVVQEHAGRTVEESRKIADTMTHEARTFAEFMAKANDREKGHLRLEADKLRRGQEEWLQVLVGLLDHVYALYRAGLNSKQPHLIHQLGNYQLACRDMARRVGLVPFEAQPDEPFRAEDHQPADAETPVAEGALVTETLVTGYTFQGQRLRRAVVTVRAEPAAAAPTAEDAAAAPLGSG